jgi:signal transduction histidine kinase
MTAERPVGAITLDLDSQVSIARYADIDFGKLFEASPFPLSLLESSYNRYLVIEANDKLLSLLGLSRAEAIGRPLCEVLGPKFSARLARAAARCLATARSASTAVDMGSATVELKCSQAGPGRVLVAWRPVRRQKKREFEAIAPLFRGASDSTIFTFHVPSQTLQQLQGGFVEWMGLPSRTVSAADVLKHTHPDDIDGILGVAETRARLKDNEVLTQTYRMRSKDGDWHWFNIRSRVMSRGPDGSVETMIGFATDISQFHMPSLALEHAYDALNHAEEVARRSIGRDLHDGTVQHLVAADLGIMAVERGRRISDEDADHLRTVRGSILAAQEQIRTLSFLLHAPTPVELGLDESLRLICAGFARRAGFSIGFTVTGERVMAGPTLQWALFSVAKEALLNVYRHAGAREANVRLAYEDGAVQLEITDNGRAGETALEEAVAAGVGVRSMRERIAEVGGELTLARTDRGFSVLARIPLAAMPVASLPRTAEGL